MRENAIKRRITSGGIMVPLVGTAKQATGIAQSAENPLARMRGAAFGVVHDDDAGGSPTEKMVSANDQVLLIAHIETDVPVDTVEASAAGDGYGVTGKV